MVNNFVGSDFTVSSINGYPSPPTYDFKTHLYGDGAAEETSTWRQDKASIFEIPIFGQRGRFFGIRLIGGIWDAVTYDAGYTVAPFEIGKLGLSYEIEEGI